MKTIDILNFTLSEDGWIHFYEYGINVLSLEIVSIVPDFYDIYEGNIEDTDLQSIIIEWVSEKENYICDCN